jgi:hypothetical protein
LPNFLFFLPEEIESKFTQFDGKSFSPFSIFFWIFPFFLSSFESYWAKGKAYINSLLLPFSLLFFWKNEPKKWQKGWEVKKNFPLLPSSYPISTSQPEEKIFLEGEILILSLEE